MMYIQGLARGVAGGALCKRKGQEKGEAPRREAPGSFQHTWIASYTCTLRQRPPVPGSYHTVCGTLQGS